MPLLLLALLGCDDKGDGDGDPTAPTWYQDVLPIVEARCLGCHREGGIGPFPMETYDQAAPWASAAAAAARAGTMPPWPPSSDCNDYVGVRSLTEEELSTLEAWAEAEAPEGDADAAVHAEPTVGALSDPDISISLPEPYTPVSSPDDYRCFLLEVTAPSDGFVTAFSVDPDQDAIVHHVIAYLVEPGQVATYQALDAADDGPGYACFGGPGGDSSLAWLGSWAPGSLGDVYPEGTGLAVPAGSTALVQMHYNLSYADPVPDQTTVNAWFSTTVERQAKLVTVRESAWPAGGLVIPPGQADVVFTSTVENPLGEAAHIWAANLHMHLLGKSTSLRVLHADGSESCALDIPDWDFHWQGMYFLEEPIEVGPDDQIEITCHFDSTGQTETVNWGEGSADEMCVGQVYATLAD